MSNCFPATGHRSDEIDGLDGRCGEKKGSEVGENDVEFERRMSDV